MEEKKKEKETQKEFQNYLSECVVEEDGHAGEVVRGARRCVGGAACHEAGVPALEGGGVPGLHGCADWRPREHLVARVNLAAMRAVGVSTCDSLGSVEEDCGGVAGVI